MRFLTCEPNLKQINDYKDEADQFDSNPEEWFTQNKRMNKPISLVVIFENYYKRLEEIAVNNTETARFLDRFKVKEKFAHSIVGQSRRTGNFLYLLNLKENANFKCKFHK